MKDGGGRGSGSDGDDGYIALYTVLPCVAIIFVLIVSFLVLVSVWVACYVLRKRRVNMERKVLQYFTFKVSDSIFVDSQ